MGISVRTAETETATNPLLSTTIQHHAVHRPHAGPAYAANDLHQEHAHVRCTHETCRLHASVAVSIACDVRSFEVLSLSVFVVSARHMQRGQWGQGGADMALHESRGAESVWGLLGCEEANIVARGAQARCGLSARPPLLRMHHYPSIMTLRTST